MQRLGWIVSIAIATALAFGGLLAGLDALTQGDGQFRDAPHDFRSDHRATDRPDGAGDLHELRNVFGLHRSHPDPHRRQGDDLASGFMPAASGDKDEQERKEEKGFHDSGRSGLGNERQDRRYRVFGEQLLPCEDDQQEAECIAEPGQKRPPRCIRQMLMQDRLSEYRKADRQSRGDAGPP